MIKEPGKILLILTIKIPSGRKEQLTVHENDIPEELVDKFISRHGLSITLKPVLMEQVLDHIKSLIKEQSSQVTSFSNVGERLYHKGQQHIARQQQHTKRKQEEQIQEERRAFTFRPHINSSAPDLRLRPSKIKEDPQPERIQYTFSPRINKASQKMAEKCSRSSDKFSELYYDAFERKHRKEVVEKDFYKTEYRFKPDINAHGVSQVPVVERLLKAKETAEEHLAIQKDRLNQDVDPLTGKNCSVLPLGGPPRYLGTLRTYL